MTEPDDDPGPRNQTIDNLQFVLTCSSAPEQYDVFDDGRKVAYVRLRFSRLTAECPDVGGEKLGTWVESSWADWGGYCGMFEDDEQRGRLLREVAAEVHQWLDREAGAIR